MATKQIERGLFITFEGGEGAGKTTQIQSLKEHLEEFGYSVKVTREPGGTPLGEQLREMLMAFHEEQIAPETELMLFSASRIQHMKRVILPFLNEGGIVLCDRFIDSTTAYQGYGRHLSLKLIDEMNRVAVCDRFPDLTFLLDLDVNLGLNRVHKRYEMAGNAVADRIEAEALEFHQAVRQGFLEIARKNASRVKVIDANRAAEIIAADLWWEVYHAIE